MSRNGGERLLAFSHFREVNPHRIESYLERGGYVALRQAVLERRPQDIVEQIGRAGLRGRGGAGFPTAAKWRVTSSARSEEKYVVANAYDADPRSPIGQALLEQNPQRVIEGLAITAYAVGASHGFIYLASGKPEAWNGLQVALDQARQHGFLGSQVLGSRFSFDVTPVLGWGGFIGGEETAALAAIEGRRAMPEQKPPYPAQRGLWGKPTVVNSAETLACVPWILVHGEEAFAKLGTPQAHGTKVVALGGEVRYPGLVEVECGTTLRMLVGVLGGGEPDGVSVRAIQVGGPSGGFLPESLWDTPLEYDALESVGVMMGSGSVSAVGQHCCMVDLARASLSYLASEACGKCVPCRLGTKRITGVLEAISGGLGREDDLDLLEDLCGTVSDGSLCGFGIAAPIPVLTALRYFREDYLMHVRDGRCPTGSCQAVRTHRYEKKGVL